MSKRKFLFSIFFIIFIIIVGTKNIYAVETRTIEKSEQFKKWETLSLEDRKKAIQPMFSKSSYKNTITDPNKRMAQFNAILKSGTLESSYCLDKNNIRVKNQHLVSSCWAFAFSSMFETTAYKQNNTNNEYSPEHLDYSAADTYNVSVGEGGNYYEATAYNAAGYGPVLEEDFPFDSVYNPNIYGASNNYLKDVDDVDWRSITSRAMAKDIKFFPNIYKAYSTNRITYLDDEGSTYSSSEVQAMRNEIKQHIVDYGGVATFFYSDMGTTATGIISSNENYYNSTNNAFYCNDSDKVANHAVTIVGWDDNYSKNNFNSSHRPLNNGAYIVLNSWGDDVHDNGYFYVSYDDVCIEQGMIGLENIEEYEEDSSESYDYIYQYDELGVSLAIYYPSSVGYMANRFENQIDNGELEENEKQVLNSIGVYLWDSEGIEIYLNKSGRLNLEDSIKIASFTGTNSLQQGFHKIDLDTPLELNDGSSFSIIVKYISNSSTYPATGAIECNYRTVGLADVETIYDAVTSNQYESFYSEDGEDFIDLYDLENSDTGLNYRNTNACIKAYTQIVEKNPDDPDNPNVYKQGDFNVDGNIDVTDVLAIKNYIIFTLSGRGNYEGISEEDAINYGDMNNNNIIDLTDVILLKRKIVEELLNL